MEHAERKYVGFWARVWASVIDSLLLVMIIVPLLFFIYGKDYLALPDTDLGLWYYLFVWVLPAAVIFLFWFFRAATPGKMLIGAKIVDFKTGGKLTYWQVIVRYLGYFASTFAVMLGFIWIAVDDYKQGWHDKLASTAVIYDIKNRALTRIMLLVSVIFVVAFFGVSYISLTRLVENQLTAAHDVTTGQYIAEGFEYGQNVSTSECWQQTVRRVGNCSDLRCQFNQSYFLKACMGASYATTQSRG